jgi:hypothetical protein
VSKKTVYKSEEQAEAAKEKAARFVADVIGDPDRASEIESESLSDWLEETGRRIENPKTKGEKIMARTTRTKAPTVAALREENESLREERDTLQLALDDANDRLSQIYDLSAEEDLEDFEDSDDDEENEDDEEEES